ncbi:hypothetical protein HZB00_01250 [Candidatus Woesearchaeota archaeon]|nr:hypothetical protein [Candidatus Woesearchaeota archaeon]
MRKGLIALIIIFSLLATSIFAAAQVKFVSVTVNPTSGKPGDTVQVSLIVNNTDTDPSGSTIPSIVLASTQLNGPNNAVISAPASLPTFANVINGTPQSGSFSVKLPSVAPGVYTGTLTATDSSNPLNKDIKSYVVTVNSTPSVAFVTSSVLFVGRESDTLKQTVTVQNTGNIPLTDLVVNTTLGDLNDDQGRKVVLSTNPQKATIAPGSKQDFEVSAAIAPGHDLLKATGNMYTTSVEIAKDQSPTIPIEVNVVPLTCSSGNQGKIHIDVITPDNGDEYEAGAKIPVEVDVDNRGSSRARFQVEASLYNIDRSRKLDRVLSDSKSLDASDSARFTAELQLPVDARDSDSYVVYIKAFERGSESTNCQFVSKDIQVKEIKDRIVINSLDISPLTPSCGDTVYGTMRVTNTGTNTQRPTLSLRSEIIVQQTSQSFVLQGVDGTDNTGIWQFSFKVPDKTPQGQYTLVGSVNYAGLSTSAQQTYQVVNCNIQPVPPVPGSGSTTVTPNTGQNNATTSSAATVYAKKSVFDQLGSALDNVPTSFWLFADMVLVLAFLVLAVSLARRRR